MMALFWKDWRVNRFVLIFGFVFLIGPLLGGVIRSLVGQWRHGSPVTPWALLLVHCSFFSLAISFLTIGMLGGNAVASERADRSAEFLAYLPPSRLMVIGCKAVLALTACAIIWAFNLAVAYGIAPLVNQSADNLANPYTDMVMPMMATSVVLFGSAWCVSCFSSSAAIATGIGFAVPIIIATLLAGINEWLVDGTLAVGWWYQTLCIGLGILSFWLGFGYYLRRIEP